MYVLNVEPKLMVPLDVHFKSICEPIKLKNIQRILPTPSLCHIWNKYFSYLLPASIFSPLILFFFNYKFTCEGINDNSENDIQKGHFYQHEEGNIYQPTGVPSIQVVNVIRLRLGDIRDTSTFYETLIDYWNIKYKVCINYKALQQCCALIFHVFYPFTIENARKYVSVIHEVKCQKCVNVNENYS